MNTNTLKRKRIDELDIIKGIAILMVCFHHINELTGVTALNNPVIMKIFTFQESYMVLFFLCSGYVFSGKGSVWQNIFKKIKQLLLPLLKIGIADTAIYFLRYIIIEKQSLLWFADNTATNFLGFSNWNIRLGEVIPNQMSYAFVPYWFIFELFSAFCIFIPIKKLVGKRHISLQVLATALLFGIAMVFNRFDIQHTLADTFNSNVSFFLVLINVFGFAALLMLGNLVKSFDLFDMEAHKTAFNVIAALISLAGCVVLFATYKNTGYALQYGKWGPFGYLSIPVTALGGLFVTYLLIFISQYLKKIKVLKTALSYLGSNSLYILLLHFAIAECICWIGGFWHDIYHGEPFPAEEFSLLKFGITVVGTAVVIGAYFAVKSFIIKRKKVKSV